MIAATKASLPLGRRLAGYGLAAAAAPLLTLVLSSLRGQLDPTTDVLAFLLAVIAVALSGSLIPAVLEAVGGSLLIIFYFAPPRHPVTIAGANNAAVLGVFVAVALAVGLLARDAARRTRQAARAAAECDLLATRLAAATGCGPRCSRRSATTCARRWPRRRRRSAACVLVTSR
jgi:two-component system sensor histidine kinase KdpD